MKNLAILGLVKEQVISYNDTEYSDEIKQLALRILDIIYVCRIDIANKIWVKGAKEIYIYNTQKEDRDKACKFICNILKNLKVSVYKKEISRNFWRVMYYDSYADKSIEIWFRDKKSASDFIEYEKRYLYECHTFNSIAKIMSTGNYMINRCTI